MSAPRKYSVEGSVASVIFIVLFIVVLVQIFGRSPLYRGPVWTEELARWLWVWMAFIGIAEVERIDGQLRMGFLADALKAKARRVLFTLIDIVYLGIMGHLCWIGWTTVRRTWNNESVTLPTTDALLYASAFVASFLILHRIIRRILSRFGANGDDGAHLETPL
ncbi:TRAP transporter small permease [Maliponia aquimaris]|uniref:TRAP transporter small permease protein n=1 Tax=Maliponia aquimaris TaxID=1673631 RepID=A0A238L1J6_9RHOB|nr:TRAP transporter small permease [Maliponia aquimaris]SMX48889.1 2,3-diketo-L-gulonate TRAP transporter small permease protein YiaM [Maliponia aquimaris]